MMAELVDESWPSGGEPTHADDEQPEKSSDTSSGEFPLTANVAPGWSDFDPFAYDDRCV